MLIFIIIIANELLRAQSDQTAAKADVKERKLQRVFVVVCLAHNNTCVMYYSCIYCLRGFLHLR